MRKFFLPVAQRIVLPFAILALLLFIPVMTYGETFVVDTQDDVVDENDLLLSLREAVAFATANAEEDIIVFNRRVRRITLELGQITVDDGNGDQVLLIGPVTIRGDGDRLFELVTDAEFINVTFEDGEAIGGNVDGGAVFIQGGATGDFINCSFRDNVANNLGGAVQSQGNATFNGCRFDKNEAGTDGGAVNIGVVGQVDFDFCEFRQNEASNDGGAINNNANFGTIANCVFDKNSAANNGGAINNNANGDEVISCVFRNNRAAVQGGAYFDAGNSVLQTVISGTIFEKNRAGSGNINDNGGAINALANSNIVLEDCVFDGNQATFNGGAIFTDGDMVILDCNFAKNRTIDNNGGAIFIDNSGNVAAVTIDRCLFEKNRTANQGGGTYTNDNADVTVTNTTYSGNSAVNDGGAHFDDTAVTTFLFCTITKNKAKLTGGGITTDGDVTLNSTLVDDNKAGDGNDLSGDFNDASDFNLVEDGDGHDIAGNNNIIGLDGDLQGLKNNGGPTKTHALDDDSAAINAGDPAQSPGNVDDDQRGFVRPDDGVNPDIGAFEFGAIEPDARIEDLQAAVDSGKTTLQWRVAKGEIAGFHIWRCKTTQRHYTRISGALLPMQGKKCTFEDREAVAADFGQKFVRDLYKIEMVLRDGTRCFSPTVIARYGKNIAKLQSMRQRSDK